MKPWQISLGISHRHEVSISLDSVIFRDNTFIEPDHAGKFEEENRERRIKQELVAELLNQASSGRSALKMLQQLPNLAKDTG